MLSNNIQRNIATIVRYNIPTLWGEWVQFLRGKQPRDSTLMFRHELKYLISLNDAQTLKQRLGLLLTRDENVNESGIYKVRSIYFDDYWNSSYEEKMMGVASRSKYRIRVYNDSDSYIQLERKLKQGNLVCKQSAGLTRDEVEKILSGDYGFLLANKQQLCKEFYYECTAKKMRPRVIVDYEREPYVFAPGDVRITFDMDVRAALLNFNIFDSHLPTLNVLEPGYMILEVKYTEFLPAVIRRVLPQKSSQMLAVSKFIMVCDKATFLSSHIN